MRARLAALAGLAVALLLGGAAAITQHTSADAVGKGYEIEFVHTRAAEQVSSARLLQQRRAAAWTSGMRPSCCWAGRRARQLPCRQQRDSGRQRPDQRPAPLLASSPCVSGAG